MSGQNAVGFGFQADIVNTASMGHLLTGRVLKAMSDGGIDLYAVAAAVYLGKYIPVRKELESTVRPHISSRGSFRSVLNNILSIGWGHSEVAIELSRTQAGTNALLLVGALATGGWSPFQAAQCFSELLSLNGCEVDRLPNIDVLKGLVEYLAPITFDLGFSKVLEHITTVAARAIRLCDHDVPDKKDPHPPQIFHLGNAPMLAGAIKQLALTAERGERMYMVLKRHGSWLPAFASHILGMEVELRYTLVDDGDSVVWACAGDQGSVVFELGEQGSRVVSPYRTTGSAIEIVDCLEIHGILRVDYLLQDALQAQLSPWPEIGNDLYQGIGKAIARRSWDLLQSLQIIESRTLAPRHFINGHFNSIVALKQTLGSMGISEPSQGVIGLPLSRTNALLQDWAHSRWLKYLDSEDLHALMNSCTPTSHPPQSHPVLAEVSQIINCSAASAVALMQCKFDASRLRVRLQSAITSSWGSSCRSLDLDPEKYHSRIYVDHNEVLQHLHYILFGYTLPFDTIKNPGIRAMGFSSGAYTALCTAVMQHDSYDALGRTISIMSGRASVKGSLRDTIIECCPLRPVYSLIRNDRKPSTLATGSFVEPHCRPSATNVFLQIDLTEDHIVLDFAIGRVVSEAIHVSLMEGISTLLGCWTVPRCPHDKDTPVKLKNDMHMELVGFDGIDSMWLTDPGEDSNLVFIALRGNKLQQLLTCAIKSNIAKSDDGPGMVLSSSFGTSILQTEACLKCCIEIAREAGNSSAIIMGG